MKEAGFTGLAYEDLLAFQHSQPKPAEATSRETIFLLIFLRTTAHQRTHSYSLPRNIFFEFPHQAVCQVGIFSLPVGLA